MAFNCDIEINPQKMKETQAVVGMVDTQNEIQEADARVTRQIKQEQSDHKLWLETRESRRADLKVIGSTWTDTQKIRYINEGVVPED